MVLGDAVAVDMVGQPREPKRHRVDDEEAEDTVTLRTGSDRLFVGRVETDSDELVERCAALVQDAERTESGARQRPGLFHQVA